MGTEEIPHLQDINETLKLMLTELKEIKIQLNDVNFKLDSQR